MEEKEKNPRLRRFTHLSPEAQAARLGTRAILAAGAPPPTQGDYMPLAEAAAQFGHTLDALLDKGISGELDVYAPVLAEGEYVWPVTERGIPHSRIMGVADPIFRARFQLGDYMGLTARDIKKIKLGAQVIPEGFIGPAVTLQFIEAWEAERQAEQAERLAKECTLGPPLPRSAVSPMWRWQDSACERMRELVKQVAWTPLAWVTNRDGGGMPARNDFMVRADMLRVERSAVQYLPAETRAATDDPAGQPHNAIQRSQADAAQQDGTVTVHSEQWHAPQKDTAVQAPHGGLDAGVTTAASTIHRSIAENPGTASLQRKTGRPGKRPGLHPEIIHAQTEARQKGLDDNDPTVIWGILVRMSEEPGSKSTRLRGYNRKGIQYIAGDGLNTYTCSALTKYLRPKLPDIPE